MRDVLKDLGGSTVAGTFGYMAPEQFAGDATPASDVYALGALAVALLTRRDPQSLLGLDRHLHWQPHASVRPGTASLIDAMLAEEPAERPAARDLADRVSQARTARPTQLVRRNEVPPTPARRGNMLSVEIDGEPDPQTYGRITSVIERELGISGHAPWSAARCAGGPR
ncbi:MAG: hypothetical protein GY913_16105 [Proteobacteria bacterium]|nr:hypothetical protein [Pseudomonadota bacterium]MCP4918429.1 hypothetical protein [Pseudomonadota bacterium]